MILVSIFTCLFSGLLNRKCWILLAPLLVSQRLSSQSLWGTPLYIHYTFVRLALVCKLCSSIITKIVWPQRLPCDTRPPAGTFWESFILPYCTALNTRAQGLSNIHDPGHVLGLPCQNSACPSTIGPLLFSYMGIRSKVFLSRDGVQWAMQLCCVKNPQACYTVLTSSWDSALGGGSMRIHNESKVNLWYTRPCQTK